MPLKWSSVPHKIAFKPNFFKKGKFFFLGNADRYTPLQTSAKFPGGTSSSSSLSVCYLKNNK